MSQSFEAQAFADKCPKGHQLQGWVKYCPFCGVLVVQPTTALPPDEAGPKPVDVDPQIQEPDPLTHQPEPVPPSTGEPTPPQQPGTKPPEQLPGGPGTPPRTDPPKIDGQEKETPKQDPPPPPPPPWKWILIALVVVLVGGYYLLPNHDKKQDACDNALSVAANKLVSGDSAAARDQALLAIASCTGEGQSKASALKTAAEKNIAAQANCERGIRSIDTLFNEHQLQKARRQLDGLNTACAKSSTAENLRQKIIKDQATADEAASEVRKLLKEGDVRGANSALEKLTTYNREHPDLATLRDDLLRTIKDQETKKPVAVEPPKVVQERAELPIPSYAKPASPLQAPQAAQAQSFIRSAEQALAQNQFDRAKTQVENALNIDPRNAQATALARRIKERELQYLKDETTIK